MLCPYCGAWTEVKQTRTRPDGSEVRRHRACANMHTFTTYETLPPQPALLKRRNEQAIRRVVTDGLSITEAAREFGMPRSELSRKVSALHPEFNGRSAGQARRWAAQRSKTC